MSRSRHLLAAVAAAGVLALAACSSGTSADTPTTTAPTTTGADALDPTTAWADGICSSLTDVRTAVDGIGEGLQVNPLDGTAAIDDAKAQISAQVDAVSASVADVRTAVGAAPDEPGAQEVKAELETALDDLDAARQEVATQAASVASAESAADFVAAAGAALLAVQAAASAVGDVYGTATEGASGARAEVRAAFEAAPACQAFQG